VEQQEVPNEYAAIHSLRACQKDAIACQEMMEACVACGQPTSMDMESEAKHWEVSKEHATVDNGKALSKWHRDRHLVAGRSGKPKELTREDCGSRRKLAAACRKMSRSPRVA
jgi:hypothetical protein